MTLSDAKFAGPAVFNHAAMPNALRSRQIVLPLRPIFLPSVPALNSNRSISHFLPALLRAELLKGSRIDFCVVNPLLSTLFILDFGEWRKVFLKSHPFDSEVFIDDEFSGRIVCNKHTYLVYMTNCTCLITQLCELMLMRWPAFSEIYAKVTINHRKQFRGPILEPDTTDDALEAVILNAPQATMHSTISFSRRKLWMFTLIDESGAPVLSGENSTATPFRSGTHL